MYCTGMVLVVVVVLPFDWFSCRVRRNGQEGESAKPLSREKIRVPIYSRLHQIV